MRDCSGAFFVGLSTYAGVNEEMMFCVKLALCRVMLVVLGSPHPVLRCYHG
jgi:hypothetical protein